jgi:hypothetical protein
MRALVKFGGTRIGDMFHVIPLLKKLQDMDYDVDLAHGKYELGAAKLLLHLKLVKKLYSSDFVDGNINTDMGSIIRFLNYIEDIYDEEEKYDVIIEPARNPGEDPMAQRGLSGLFQSNVDIGIDFNTVPWAVTEIPNVIVGDWKPEGAEYIGVQPASISGFKTYNPLYAVEYPDDVKSFGFQTDRPIDNAIVIHGKDMVEVYEELLTCRMVVSTHSSIGVLAFYLGIPQIFIHFWPTGLANLAERELTVQPKEPGMSELQRVIDDLYIKVKEKNYGQE